MARHSAAAASLSGRERARVFPKRRAAATCAANAHRDSVVTREPSHSVAMSRDYRIPEYHPYMHPHMHEMQNAGQHYSYLPHSQTMNPSASPAYEMTAASAGSACELPSAPLAHALHDPRKRKASHFGAPGGGGENYDMCDSQQPVAASATRKRKSSSFGNASLYDDDLCEDSRSSRASTMPDKKQNHSEIEKRRRDKMNTYITELSAMIPMCGAMARKLDKLTVLRMAVQHLRSVRGSLSACPLTARPRPAFVSERELNALILQAASDSFLIVVGCDRGRLLYVSHSVSRMLHYDQSELLGQSMFDILHPKDVAKVKEQLSSSDLSPRERLIDAKTMLPVKSDMVAGASRLCPGARRSFFCRIKCKQNPDGAAPVKEETDPAAKHRKKNERKYCVVQCTGYLKSWAPAEIETGCVEGDDEQCNVSCLVAVGRALPEPHAPAPQPQPQAPPTRRLQYVSRHAIDGKFLFVDQRVTLALGFLPQELLGTSLYEYVSGPELGGVARTHKQALLRRDPLHSPPYGFRRKDGSRATIQTHFKPFRNPWTKEVECLVANNTIISEGSTSDEAQQHYEAFKQKGDAEVQRLIESQVESHKIGNAIAEEALRRSPPHQGFSPLPHDLLADPVFNPSSLVDNILGVDESYTVRNNVPLSAAGGVSPAEARGPPSPAGGAGGGCSPPLPLDGNGEAAMAVIMSLLEADAGLGGPINFSGLPWPLP